MSKDLAETMQVLRPAPNILAFYDGRIAGRRLHGPQPNWLDDGGYTLGTCSYALVDGDQALVYDTHMSPDHARRIRQSVEAQGARQIRVVLSHHHLDHIAGNAVFQDCEILANAATAAAMEAERASAAAADPPVETIMPDTVFEDDMDLMVGRIPVELRSFDIHSQDGLVLWLPDTETLFAGDTLEDTVTYVAEPDRLHQHLAELKRLTHLGARHILPNHGAPDIIGDGGYGPDLIAATQAYIVRLLKCPSDPALAALPLTDFILPETITGAIRHVPAYDEVHERNVAAVLGA